MGRQSDKLAVAFIRHRCRVDEFAFQLRKLGWATHGMGGILRDKITAELQVPANFNIEMMIAIGKPGNAADLPEPYRAREIQSDRMSQKLFASEGVLPIDWTKNS